MSRGATMTRKQEHDRIEKLETELRELRAAHEQRVADDCCCHHPHVTAPYVPTIYPAYPTVPSFYWWNSGTSIADGSGVRVGSTTVLDGSVPYTLTDGSAR